MPQDAQTQANQENELQAWLHLEQIPRFGAKKLLKLLEQHQLELKELLEQSELNLAKLGFDALQIKILRSPNRKYIDKSLFWLSESSDRFIFTFDNVDYPPLLKEISKPPLLIYGCGEPSSLLSSQIAMVGSRNPSASGKENAKYFARSLSNCGWTITSGLALGIDGLSHHGALSGSGTTVAVLGTGIDYIYPRRHLQLA